WRQQRELAAAGGGVSWREQATAIEQAGGSASRRRERRQAATRAGSSRRQRLRRQSMAATRVGVSQLRRRGLGTGTWVSGRAWIRSARARLDPLPSLIIDALVQYDGAKNISAAPFPVKAKSLM
uniref:Uncharacterized protein n=1 Tax=Oryza glaberrima TaxID=4538 RepID=I1NNA2_ORYGL